MAAPAQRALLSLLAPLAPLALLAPLAFLVAGCTQAQADPPPFKAAFTVIQLMEGPIAHAAEDYWGSVSTIVDAKGITENFPRTDEEWEHVWAAGVTIAESGNLLMMSPRAQEGDWMKWSAALVDVGVEAAKSAESKDPEQVLAVGERVYNVCTSCHMQYIKEE
jgi:hypothetical protein